jgi:hypothetical protein
MAATRVRAPLGARFDPLARILATQIELGALFGSHIMARVARMAFWDNASLVVPIALAGVAIFIIALIRGGSLFRMFALFGGLVLAAALTTPVITHDQPAWFVLGHPGAGQRYYLIPMLVFVGALFTLAADPHLWCRRIGIVLSLTLLIGIAGDWRYRDMPPTGFDAMARQFADAAPGTRMVFPLHPIGVAPMVLTKQ